MSVLQRTELEESPLADLHAIASELGVAGFRRLRRDALVAQILEAQGADTAPGEEEATEAGMAEEVDVDDDVTEAGTPEPARASERRAPPEAGAGGGAEAVEERLVTGLLDVSANGGGFLRVDPAAATGDDVYVSPAQIKRCELRPGDELSGPVRPPRRGERHPALVRVASVNGRDPEPPEPRPRFEELTPVFPSERLNVTGPLAGVVLGRGSRVAVSGPPGSGATALLREVAATLAREHDDLAVQVALAGARPEEVAEWRREAGVPVAGGSFDIPPDARAQAIELAVERAKRQVERGGHAALVVDSLDALPQDAQRRVLGAGRATEEGGTLTVVASTGMTAEPQRLATTRVVLEPGDDGGGPRVLRSVTMRAERLAG